MASDACATGVEYRLYDKEVCVVADFYSINAVTSGFPSHMISRLSDAYFINWSRSFSHCFVDSKAFKLANFNH